MLNWSAWFSLSNKSLLNCTTNWARLAAFQWKQWMHMENAHVLCNTIHSFSAVSLINLHSITCQPLFIYQTIHTNHWSDVRVNWQLKTSFLPNTEFTTVKHNRFDLYRILFAFYICVSPIKFSFISLIIDEWLLSLIWRNFNQYSI